MRCTSSGPPAIFQRPIATSSLLSTIPRGATHTRMEGLVDTLQDKLTIAANVEQRTDNSTTRFLALRDIQHQRPKYSQLDPLQDNIVFQLVDIESSQWSHESRDVLMYGVTESGNTVLATVTGSRPYFYPYPKKLQLRDNTVATAYIDPHTDIATCFLADRQLPGMGGWIECPAETYALTETSDQVSRCQIELTIPHNALNASDSRIPDAPLRILYFDIESMTREDPKKPGKFISESLQDPVIQISNVVSHLGTKDPFLRVIFTVGSCDPIEGAYVRSYTSEREMLAAWQEFIHDIDPDVMTGWNILNFDLDYLITRGRQLGFDLILGRLKAGPPTSSEPQTWYSLKYKDWMGRTVAIPGRVVLDMFRHFACNHDKFRLRSYKLRNVAARLLREPGMLKGDVAYSDIPKLQAGPDANSSTRRELAVYCLQDSYIPLVLQHKYRILEEYIEMGKTKRMLFRHMMYRKRLVEKLTKST
ncbi:ribonuclease H-like protein [Guyanagaster necrorhizus]|uniref:DNA polymerase delta catalytic subunit n=1 Tax=Guyanagaster necrorhizus TaxID=856835 RepID=A0A9P8APP9_9AGAR|nr:ribonuclease H-like protein [Guyanagaster necrorhizus MCA 3950]KAG7443209.1 ribonuclease H-like protein [Guyanagaster necrorhizus MCA 3950]